MEINSDKSQKRRGFKIGMYSRTQIQKRSVKQKHRYQKANTRDARALTSLVTDFASFQQSTTLEMSIHRTLHSLRGQRTYKRSHSAVPWGRGRGEGGRLPCSQPPTTLQVTAAQRAFMWHSQGPRKKQKQTKNLPPECLECKLSSEILSQVFLCSELMPLFLTSPKWSPRRFTETWGLNVISSFIIWPKSLAKRDNTNRKLLSQWQVCVFLIKALIWSIRPGIP